MRNLTGGKKKDNFNIQYAMQEDSQAHINLTVLKSNFTLNVLESFTKTLLVCPGL